MSDEKKSEELNIVNESDLPKIPEAFAAEYKKRMAEQTPDIWDRIVAGIGEESAPGEAAPVTEPQKKKGGIIAHFRKFGAYYGVAAAAVLCIAIAVPVLMNTKYAATNEAEAPAPHQSKRDGAGSYGDMEAFAVGGDEKYSEETYYDDAECAEAEESDDLFINSDDYSSAGDSQAAEESADETSDMDTDYENQYEMIIETVKAEIISMEKDNDYIITFIVKDENGMELMLNNGPMYYSERFIENTISYKDYDRLCDNMADLNEGDTIEAVIVYYDNDIRGLDETDTLFIFGMK